MVKNSKGGSKSKKLARKNEGKEEYIFRYASGEGEMYASVVKMLGGMWCEVICNDGKRRLAYLPGKLRGRNKKSNKIAVDTKVIIGLREWQTMRVTDSKLEKCDVLEVYDHDEEFKLRHAPGINWKGLSITSDGHEDEAEEDATEDAFVFEEL
jgi:translation initiation factor 1A